jgi:2-oxoisovalerate dehydrogenase E1 component
MQAVAGWIAQNAFEQLDAPPQVIGSAEVPAVPLSLVLEKAYLPSLEEMARAVEGLLRY